VSHLEELAILANLLDNADENSITDSIVSQLDKYIIASELAGRAHSDSWLGYHANVYYRGLEIPPPGTRFSIEWGFIPKIGEPGTIGEWEEVPSDFVRNWIYNKSGKVEISPIKSFATKIQSAFEIAKASIDSILTIIQQETPDPYIDSIAIVIRKQTPFSTQETIDSFAPRVQRISRDSFYVGQRISWDSAAFGQGMRTPPHITELAEAISLKHNALLCRALRTEVINLKSHLNRRVRVAKPKQPNGTKVFIGHGRSGAWRELKDFVVDRARLSWDEFNRVPVAGVTNIARLTEMLDSSAIAFLVMTAEDEMLDGGFQARMNVVHEAGLFQGRLGFTKAIVLIEDGCAEFSNIQGLGQIRFPKGNIAASFEAVRLILEREGLMSS
jgi:predicted nucleotide-binding protein